MKIMLKISIILSLLLISSVRVSPEVDLKICIPCFSKEFSGVKFPNNVYIIIDPGHGAPPAERGESCGTSSRDYVNNPPQSDVQDKPEIAERYVVLEVAQKLQEELRSFGFKHIELTRDSDISQDNKKKADIIREYIFNSHEEYYKSCHNAPNCCDSFVPIVISLHCNGGPPKASGSETYYQEDMKNYLPGVVLSYLYFFMGNHISIPGPIDGLITVSLEQRNSITSHYEKIAGIYQTRYSYGINESFQYSGTYTPAYILPPGLYQVAVLYRDETHAQPIDKAHHLVYKYLMVADLDLDKSSYRYGETAQAQVKIAGTGNMHIDFSCPEAGIGETRDIVIPEGIFSTIETFPVPIGMKDSYNLAVKVADQSGFNQEIQGSILLLPITWDIGTDFPQPTGKAGVPLDFQVHIKALSEIFLLKISRTYAILSSYKFLSKRYKNLKI